MNNNKHDHIIEWVVFLSMLTLFLFYCFLRAYLLSFTHDEACSYAIILGHEVFPNTPNNHMFNTILMAISRRMINDSEWALRLPNVLGGALYFYGGYKIIKGKGPGMLFLGLSMLLAHHFVIEFFSLARGYGIALGFMLMSLYFTLRNNSKPASMHQWSINFALAICFATCAIYANLAFINFYISILVYFVVQYIQRRIETKYLPENDSLFLKMTYVSLVPLALGVKRLLFLRDTKQLNFGANSLSECFDSLISTAIYATTPDPRLILILKIFFLINLLLGLILPLVNKSCNTKLFGISSILLMLIAGLILENYLFGVKFPFRRTAIYFYPLFALQTYSLLVFIFTRYRIIKSVKITFILLLTILIYLNLGKAINIKKTSTWRYNMNTKEAMVLIKNNIRSQKQDYSISNHWLLEPSINYYIMRWNLNMQPANRDGINEESDFILGHHYNKAPESYVLIRRFPDSKSSLWIKNDSR